MYKQFLIYLFCLLPLTLFFKLNPRSPYRKTDPQINTLCASWPLDNQKYFLKNHFFEKEQIFNKFDPQDFIDYKLPDNKIVFRHNNGWANGSDIDESINKLLIELASNKRFTDFDILKNRDFNKKEKTGLLVLKSKKLPFVIKLFLENPKSIAKPLKKGLQSRALFIMGYGINRHLAGFTRIKNLNIIKKEIENNKYWKNKIETPRKWFWLPKNPIFIELTSNTNNIKIPAIYAIVADYMDNGIELSLFNKDDRSTVMDISKFLGNKIDPQISNFLRNRNSNKIMLIDTEHFPTMVGLKETLYYKSHAEWYMKLGTKLLKDSYCLPKYQRLINQKNPAHFIPICVDNAFKTE